MKHRNYNKKLISYTLFLFLIFSGIPIFAVNNLYAFEKKLVLVGSASANNSFQGQWLTLIYTEIYKRLGYNFKLQRYPAKRASYLSDSGYVDGEINRVYSYNDKHPELIRVEEPHFYINFNAFASNKKIRLNGWQSLKGTSFRVSYRLGVKKCESKLPELVNAQNLGYVYSVSEGLKLLYKGRVDIFIDAGFIINAVISRSNFLKKQNLFNVGLMEKVSAHTFLHKKNKTLVPKINMMLKQLKEEGLIEKFKQIAIRNL